MAKFNTIKDLDAKGKVVFVRADLNVPFKDGKVTDVKFIGGCSGNLQGISRLVKGRDIDEVIETLKGIKCRNNTSCPDQLAQALIEYKIKNNL